MQNTYIKNKAIYFLAIFATVLAFTASFGVNTADAAYYSYGSYGDQRSTLPFANYNNNYSYVRPQPVAVYYPQPVYYQSYPALSVSCYANTYSSPTGNTVTWSANVSGGNGSYTYSWSGTDSLYGSSNIISKAYYNTGSKYATVTVYSNGQSMTQSCGGPVNVYQTYNYQAYTPIYYSSYNYSPITVSCSPNMTYSVLGTPITWSAIVSGGNGSYTYSWSGSDNMYGSAQNISINYSSLGQKNATVTVYSNGQSVTQACNNTVFVSNNYVNPYSNNIISNSNIGNLDIGCYADPTSSSINQPVTWNAEITGGVAPYKYSWTGSDGLTGTTQTVIKYYSTSGEKSAIVSVTSADGKTGTRACSNLATVKVAPTVQNYVRKTTSTPVAQVAAPVQKVAVDTAQAPSNSASVVASLFSLSNVPWGWVAVLVILVLFATVMYLLFNAKKI